MSLNVLLINDSTSNSNWGDRAAALALKHMIAASAGNCFSAITEDDLRYDRILPTRSLPASVHPASRRPKWLRLLMPPIVFEMEDIARRFIDNRFSPPVRRIPQSAEDFDRCTDEWLKDPTDSRDLLEAISKADVVIIHGDGCMVGNGLIPRTILFLSYVIKHRYNKKVCIVNHTADLEHPDLLAMARVVYPLYDDVVFRDPVSVEQTRGLCHGKYCADTAFFFEPAARAVWSDIAGRTGYFDVWPDVAAFDPAQPYLCMGGSSLFYTEGSPRRIIEEYKQLVRSVQEVYPHQIVLTASDIIDQAVMRPLAHELGLPLLGLSTPVQQAVDVVGNADAYIGGRWHPSIFALRGGVPVVPLTSKTFKMQALIQMTGLDPHAFDSRNLAVEKAGIAHRLRECLRQGVELRNNLRLWAERESKDCWGNVDCLRD